MTSYLLCTANFLTPCLFEKIFKLPLGIESPSYRIARILDHKFNMEAVETVAEILMLGGDDEVAAPMAGRRFLVHPKECQIK